VQYEHSHLCCFLGGDEQPTDKQPLKLLLGRLSKAIYFLAYNPEVLAGFFLYNASFK
jgi:hypothetical protein